MKIFVPLQRVDAEQRMVWGYGSTEALCTDGFILRNEAIREALPDYMRFGNIREMHQPSAVGVARSAEVDDKGIYLGAHIVDEGAWKKVEAGVYKGFSVGAQITRRDPTTPNVITGIKILEFSLCDRPVNPESVFDIYRAEGAGVEGPPAHDPGAEAAIAALTDAVTRAESGKKAPYGDVDYADPGYQKDKKKRYPLDTEAHIRAAWNYIHKARNAKKYSTEDCAKVKAKIVGAWKEKIDKAGPPEAKANLKRVALLERGLTQMAEAAHLLHSLTELRKQVVMEEAIENDDSPQGQRLSTIIASLITYVRDGIVEETAEIADGDGDIGVHLLPELAVIEQMARPKDLLRLVAAVKEARPKFAEILERVGARHSAADMERVQKMHDTAVELGAQCHGDGAERAAPTGDLKRLEEVVKSRDATITRMARIMTDMADRVKRIEAQPLTGGPRRMQVVDRDGDGAGPQASQDQVEEFLTRFARMTDDERALELTKMALRNPQIITLERKN